MEPLDTQDYDELIGLVVKATSEEIVDTLLIQNSPSNRMISLKRLEMKLIRARDQYVFDNKPRADTLEEV